MNDERKYTIKKILFGLMTVAVIACLVFLLMSMIFGLGFAEDAKYIMCMDQVNIRMGASTGADSVGWLEPCDVVYPDGKQKNGFMHCEIPSVEAGEGWIHKGYLVDDKPEKVNQKAYVTGSGKVQARKNVNGKRTRWLKPGGELRVYWYSDNWCITDCGYVMTDFLELDGE